MNRTSSRLRGALCVEWNLNTGEQAMAEPISAQKAPDGVNVEAGKDYWLVRLRAQRQPALLRRLTQIIWLGAPKIQRHRDQTSLAVRLQVQRRQAILRWLA